MVAAGLGVAYVISGDFAEVAFSQSGDLSAGAPVFQQFGDNITDYPCDYLPGNNAKLFSAARAQALAATR